MLIMLELGHKGAASKKGDCSSLGTVHFGCAVCKVAKMAVLTLAPDYFFNTDSCHLLQKAHVSKSQFAGVDG